MMRPRLVTACLGLLLALAVIAGPATATRAPNQGDPDKVLKVNNPNVWCEDPKPGHKVEGDFGRKIFVRSDHPIDFVTVKSGKNAEVVFAKFDKFWGKIKLSKDVSNYVVWTCKKDY
jgi:hypothetical protein